MDSPARPPKAKPEEKKKTAYHRFADFLRKYRVPILALAAAALVAAIAVGIGTAISSAAVEASTARLEKLDADYQAYSGEADSAKKAELKKGLLDSIDAIVKKGSRLFAAQEALAYRARLEAADKDWAGAEKDWLAIAAAAPAGYLAPVALQQAAVAAEEQGAADRARDDYKKLVDKYSKTSIGIAHAYFALGRLAEGAKDYPAAMEAYRKIASTWPDGDWTKLATDRIIFLEARGLSK